MNAELNITAQAAEEVTDQTIAEWYTLAEQLKELKDREMEIRKRIFAAKFAEPKEGTNNFNLPAGWVLKGQYKLNRDPDISIIETMAQELRDAGIVLESLLKWKPELSTTYYKKELSDEQRKLVDACLVIKPATPSLEIVMPKRAS